MRAFLSYSLNDKDHYILTLLSIELREKGFFLTQSADFDKEMSNLTKVNIQKSNLFIGLITGNGIEKDRVQKEWRVANVADIPSVLLIEDTVEINPEFKFPYIQFNRNNPEEAIKELTDGPNDPNKIPKKESNAWAWIAGGAALLAIIGLLSKDD